MHPYLFKFSLLMQDFFMVWHPKGIESSSFSTGFRPRRIQCIYQASFDYPTRRHQKNAWGPLWNTFHEGCHG